MKTTLEEAKIDLNYLIEDLWSELQSSISRLALAKAALDKLDSLIADEQND